APRDADVKVVAAATAAAIVPGCGIQYAMPLVGNCPTVERVAGQNDELPCKQQIFFFRIDLAGKSRFGLELNDLIRRVCLEVVARSQQEEISGSLPYGVVTGRPLAPPDGRQEVGIMQVVKVVDRHEPFCEQRLEVGRIR